MRKVFRLALIVIALSVPIHAGHSRPGGESCFPCGCGTGCYCDAGEHAGPCGNRPALVTAPSVDYGSLVLVFGAVLAFGFRLYVK